MTVSRKYGKDKVLKGNFNNVDILNRTREDILDNILVLDVVNFYYKGGILSKGKDHEKTPQLLVLGSVSSKYSGKKNMNDRLTGLNLHYLTQIEVNVITNLVKNIYEYRISNPKLVTELIIQNRDKYIRRAYRQYLIEDIVEFNALHTLGNYLNVVEELEEAGSFRKKQVDENQRLLIELGLSYDSKTRRFKNIKTGRFEKKPTELFNNLGIKESDLYM